MPLWKIILGVYIGGVIAFTATPIFLTNITATWD